jgi:hypothetical protein
MDIVLNLSKDEILLLQNQIKNDINDKFKSVLGITTSNQNISSQISGQLNLYRIYSDMRSNIFSSSTDSTTILNNYYSGTLPTEITGNNENRKKLLMGLVYRRAGMLTEAEQIENSLNITPGNTTETSISFQLPQSVPSSKNFDLNINSSLANNNYLQYTGDYTAKSSINFSRMSFDNFIKYNIQYIFVNNIQKAMKLYNYIEKTNNTPEKIRDSFNSFIQLIINNASFNTQVNRIYNTIINSTQYQTYKTTLNSQYNIDNRSTSTLSNLNFDNQNNITTINILDNGFMIDMSSFLNFDTSSKDKQISISYGFNIALYLIIGLIFWRYMKNGYLSREMTFVSVLLIFIVFGIFAYTLIDYVNDKINNSYNAITLSNMKPLLYGFLIISYIIALSSLIYIFTVLIFYEDYPISSLIIQLLFGCCTLGASIFIIYTIHKQIDVINTNSVSSDNSKISTSLIFIPISLLLLFSFLFYISKNNQSLNFANPKIYNHFIILFILFILFSISFAFIRKDVIYPDKETTIKEHFNYILRFILFVFIGLFVLINIFNYFSKVNNYGIWNGVKLFNINILNSDILIYLSLLFVIVLNITSFFNIDILNAPKNITTMMLFRDFLSVTITAGVIVLLIIKYFALNKLIDPTTKILTSDINSKGNFGYLITIIITFSIVILNNLNIL